MEILTNKEEVEKNSKTTHYKLPIYLDLMDMAQLNTNVPVGNT